MAKNIVVGQETVLAVMAGGPVHHGGQQRVGSNQSIQLLHILQVTRRRTGHCALHSDLRLTLDGSPGCLFAQQFCHRETRIERYAKTLRRSGGILCNTHICSHRYHLCLFNVVLGRPELDPGFSTKGGDKQTGASRFLRTATAATYSEEEPGPPGTATRRCRTDALLLLGRRVQEQVDGPLDLVKGVRGGEVVAVQPLSELQQACDGVLIAGELPGHIGATAGGAVPYGGEALLALVTELLHVCRDALAEPRLGLDALLKEEPDGQPASRQTLHNMNGLVQHQQPGLPVAPVGVDLEQAFWEQLMIKSWSWATWAKCSRVRSDLLLQDLLDLDPGADDLLPCGNRNCLSPVGAAGEVEGVVAQLQFEKR
ncbi:hypothetical protein Z043_105780 [Scleropages formosus]|uniref:Uncharacterized protein n=1 Tax=Scleropages formosus TaxID=113540 RepID=A0A0P7UXW7_SCLFO|nr:hypothetical protein Z043_105780 [Scleropages formosus]